MSAASAHSPKVYGWCPGALRPMMSGDGLVVRVRAPLGHLTREQGIGIAELSRRFGNGLLDLSARANLQMRGIRQESHPELIAGLRKLGLVDDDAEAEARRNVLLTPFWRDGDDTHRIAKALSTALTAATDLKLPGKFGFAVDCGPAPVLQNVAADIRIERTSDGVILRADGAETGLLVTVETAANAALDLARWFLASGGAPSGRGRMKTLIANGATLPQGHTTGAMRPQQTQPLPGPCPSGTLAALAFGQIEADSFATLADLAPIRLTPWRMLLLEGLATCAPCDGAIFDAADPRLRVTACTGAPGCPQALGATRQLALDLAPTLPANQTLHVSGCAKGCAHPGPAPLTLTATGPDTFDLIRGGTAADRPAQTDLTADALRRAPDILTQGT
ncbi:precorrin-3B synthase [Rhodobacteraceae bacterium M382]|nr:precorrin-3B synthase [Rhodobacteraceae bacterium M382]